MRNDSNMESQSQGQSNLSYNDVWEPQDGGEQVVDKVQHDPQFPLKFIY